MKASKFLKVQYIPKRVYPPDYVRIGGLIKTLLDKLSTIITIHLVLLRPIASHPRFRGTRASIGNDDDIVFRCAVCQRIRDYEWNAGVPSKFWSVIAE